MLRSIAINYDPVTRTMRSFDIIDMVKVTKEQIACVFKLTESSDNMTKIDENSLREEYDKTKHAFKIHILP